MVFCAQRRGVDANNEFGDFGFSVNGNEISSAQSDTKPLEYSNPHVQGASTGEAGISFYGLRFTCETPPSH